jgi:PadR family transcriptional regulator PadR
MHIVPGYCAEKLPTRYLPLDNLQELSHSCRITGGRETIVAKPKADLLQGTLDLLILKTLELEPMHGWGVTLRIQQVSDSVLQVNQGSLYPALHRLEERGWIKASWGSSENNRQARFYELTARGRKQLAEEKENWLRLSGAVARIVGA